MSTRKLDAGVARECENGHLGVAVPFAVYECPDCHDRWTSRDRPKPWHLCRRCSRFAVKLAEESCNQCGGVLGAVVAGAWIHIECGRVFSSSDKARHCRVTASPRSSVERAAVS